LLVEYGADGGTSSAPVGGRQLGNRLVQGRMCGDRRASWPASPCAPILKRHHPGPRASRRRPARAAAGRNDTQSASLV